MAHKFYIILIISEFKMILFSNKARRWGFHFVKQNTWVLELFSFFFFCCSFEDRVKKRY